MSADGAAGDASPVIAYHLAELAVALDPTDPRHCLPRLLPHERDVLDIGCGIGQLFAAHAGHPGLAGVGVDVDAQALAYGARQQPGVRFVRASGDALPFAAHRFDLVAARVSLPYMHVPRALDEIARVLRPGGRAWLSLHPLSRTLRELAAALREARPRDVLYRGYVLCNGACLHLAGRSVRFAPNRRVESFQTAGGMRRLLHARGFSQVEVTRGRHFVVQARAG